MMESKASEMQKKGWRAAWPLAAVRPFSAVCLLAGFCVSCGGQAQSSSKGDGPSDGDEEVDESEPDPSPIEDGPPVELLIPLVAVEEGFVLFALTEVAATGALLADPIGPVNLAFGEGYSNVRRYQLSGSLSSPEAILAPSQEVVIASATPESDALEVTLLGDDILEVRVARPGTHSIVVEARAVFESATHDFTTDLSVQAHEVAGAEWSGCVMPPYVVSGSPVSSSRLYVLDAAGDYIPANNTAFNRGADVMVRAQAGTLLEAPGGLESLVATGPSQTIELHSNYGELGTIELIQPAEIDSIAPIFHFDQGGARGGGTSVVSGGEISLDFSLDPYIFVFPGARTGEQHICGGPDPDLFELRSTTPEVCTTEADGCSRRGCYTNQYVSTIANVIAEGTCTLELAAPDLNGGSGLSESYTVHIQAL